MGAKKRRMWDDVLPGWRHAQLTARDAGLHPHAHAVLSAITYLLPAHQRTDDRVRLSQVAHHAGLWDGTGTCPRSASAAAGRWLAQLADHGAIHYEPSRAGCHIALLTPAEVDAATRAPARADDDDQRAPERAQDTANARTSARQTDGPTRDPDTANARSGPSQRAIQPHPTRAGARASEGFPEDVVRGEEPEGAEIGPTGTASGGPSADPDEWDDEEGDDDVDRLSQILVDLIPPDETMGPHGDDAFAIDRHLATHVPDLRDLIAAHLADAQLDHGQVRLALRTARTVVTDCGRDLPRLDLPTRRSTTT